MTMSHVSRVAISPRVASRWKSDMFDKQNGIFILQRNLWEFVWDHWWKKGSVLQILLINQQTAAKHQAGTETNHICNVWQFSSQTRSGIVSLLLPSGFHMPTSRKARHFLFWSENVIGMYITLFNSNKAFGFSRTLLFCPKHQAQLSQVYTRSFNNWPSVSNVRVPMPPSKTLNLCLCSTHSRKTLPFHVSNGRSQSHAAFVSFRTQSLGRLEWEHLESEPHPTRTSRLLASAKRGSSWKVLRHVWWVQGLSPNLQCFSRCCFHPPCFKISSFLKMMRPQISNGNKTLESLLSLILYRWDVWDAGILFFQWYIGSPRHCRLERCAWSLQNTSQLPRGVFSCWTHWGGGFSGHQLHWGNGYFLWNWSQDTWKPREVRVASSFQQFLFCAWVKTNLM